MNIIETIRSEVERLKKNVDDSPLATEQIAGYLLALADIQKKLSTLQEKSEKPINHLADAGKMMERPRDCSMAVDKDLEEQVELSKQPVCEELEQAAKKYAQQDKWMYEHFGDVVVQAVFFGASWQKEQMLKEAVEGEIVGSVGTKQWVESNYLDNNIGKPGDKVRIIIVKED